MHAIRPHIRANLAWTAVPACFYMGVMHLVPHEGFTASWLYPQGQKRRQMACSRSSASGHAPRLRSSLPMRSISSSSSRRSMRRHLHGRLVAGASLVTSLLQLELRC